MMQRSIFAQNPYKSHKDGVELFVRVTPKSSMNRVIGVIDHGEKTYLSVSITAPPVDGKANRETILVLSDFLHVPKSTIAILRGETSREKCFLIRNINLEDIEKCF